MASHQITVSFPENVLYDLEQMAVRKKIQREEAVVAIVEEYLRREWIRARVFADHDRKRNSPEWADASRKLNRFRKTVKPIPEAELEADIQAAITAVRKRKKAVLRKAT